MTIFCYNGQFLVSIMEIKMPKPTDQLWDALQQKNHNEVINLLKANAEWINLVEEECGASLFQLAVAGGDASKNLVDFILTQPQFDLIHHDSAMTQTNIETMICSANINTLKTLINDSRVLFATQDKLSYQVATEQLIKSEKILEGYVKKDPNSAISKRVQTKVNNLKEMIDLLRDATILHALATDSAQLMTRLEVAGANPSDQLGKFGNNDFPNMLVKSSNVNIKGWFKESLEKTLQSKKANPNGFFAKAEKLAQVEKQLENLKENHQSQQGSIHKQYTQTRADLLEKAETIVGKGIK